MDPLIEGAAAIMRTETRRLESLAQNLANLATPGYKQQLPFQQVMQAQGVQHPELGSYADLNPGALVSDGNPLHVAITGNGWFEVATTRGPAYTRQGAFRIDERGRLVTPAGHVVQIEGGDAVDLKGRNLRIAADGALLEDGRAIGRLRVLDFPDRGALTRSADGLFRAAGTPGMEMTDPSLQVGAYEASNVSTADNMVRMMEAMRRAEMGQKLVHAYDDMLGRALRAPGE